MCNNSTCYQCNQPPLCAPNDCSCPIKDLSTDCVLYTGNDLSCSGIQSQTILTDLIQQLDEFICVLVEQSIFSTVLISVGSGADVYKGVDLQGRKEIKKINAVGDLVTVTPNLNDISISIDEAELTNFINGLIPEEVCIESDSLSVTEEEGCFKVELEVVSLNGSLEITQVSPGVINIEQPETTDILRFIVNSAYTGDEETGSLSKPYKTIQGAVTAYIGSTGTAQEPDFINAEIIIQKGVGYLYTGNFNLNTGTGSIILEEGTEVVSDPTGAWLCDFDTLSDTELAKLNIVLKDSSRLVLQKNGFRNRGTTVDNQLFQDYKQIAITGTGIVVQNSISLTNSYVIFESNYTVNDTYPNDGAYHFDISQVRIATNTQSIYKVGGNSQITFANCLSISAGLITSLPTSTIIFNQIGGRIRISNTSLSISPFFVVTLDKIFPVSKSTGIPCNLEIINTFIGGRMGTFISNETLLEASVTIDNLSSAVNQLSCTNIAKSPNVLWRGLTAFSCTFTTGEVDQTQVDLTSGNTISTTNTFGTKIVESLQVFGSRALAAASGAKKGNIFINRKIVNAVDLVAGVEYQVLTSGSPSLGTVGEYFTATGSETGTGTAYSYTRDILI